MSRFLDVFFSTTGVVLALGISTLWIVAKPQSRGAKRFALAIAAFYLLSSIYTVPAGIARLLAFEYAPLERVDGPPEKTAIAVLGAGSELVFGWDGRLSVANPVAGARVLEAWRIYRILQPRWIISSGGHYSPIDQGEPSSVNMRDLLVGLGVPRDRIVLESRSRNTREEAVAIAEMVGTLGVGRIILVTSAVHMRRSLGAFRAVGLNPLPAVAPDPKYRAGWSDWLRQGNTGLGLSGQIAHELAGVPYYWMRGWLK